MKTITKKLTKKLTKKEEQRNTSTISNSVFQLAHVVFLVTLVSALPDTIVNPSSSLPFSSSSSETITTRQTKSGTIPSSTTETQPRHTSTTKQSNPFMHSTTSRRARHVRPRRSVSQPPPHRPPPHEIHRRNDDPSTAAHPPPTSSNQAQPQPQDTQPQPSLRTKTKSKTKLQSTKQKQPQDNNKFLQHTSRRDNWFWNNNKYNFDPYQSEYLADPSQEYDSWALGYRMLGGFISCDDVGGDGGGSHDSGEEEGADGKACARWIMWASYVNPNYQGGGYDEYYSEEEEEEDNNNNNNCNNSNSDSGDCNDNNEANDDANNENNQKPSKLDCHSPNTDWQLLGVYRQELYQFYEQISKHVWAINDYNYITALAGLSYMTDEDCFQVGTNADGTYIYAGPQPLEGANLQIGLYSDSRCIQSFQNSRNSAYTYDSFASATQADLGEGDGYSYYAYDEYSDDIFDTWEAGQEATLSSFNDIFEPYKYCTPCMDYPSYQDGYFIGDSGTDDDDLINQCWKFHSHDSYACDSACLAMGDAQGTILQIHFGDRYYGQAWDGSSSSSGSSSNNPYANGSAATSEDRENLRKRQTARANLFLFFNTILFASCFLAYTFHMPRGGGVRKSSLSSSSAPRSLASASASLLTQEEQMVGRTGKEESLSRGHDRGGKNSAALSFSFDGGMEGGDYQPTSASMQSPRNAMTSPRNVVKSPRNVVTSPRNAMTSPRHVSSKQYSGGERNKNTGKRSSSTKKSRRSGRSAKSDSEQEIGKSKSKRRDRPTTMAAAAASATEKYYHDDSYDSSVFNSSMDSPRMVVSTKRLEWKDGTSGRRGDAERRRSGSGKRRRKKKSTSTRMGSETESQSSLSRSYYSHSDYATTDDELWEIKE